MASSPSTAENCNRYAWLYAGLPIPASAYDYYLTLDEGLNGVKFQADGSVSVDIHGSEDAPDWVYDAEAFPTEHPALGPVHGGFMKGALLIKAAIDSVIGSRPVHYCGHSYGAGRVSILAGLRAEEGLPVASITQWGEPRAGGAKLRALVHGISQESWCNADAHGHDRVCDVPPEAPLPFPLGFSYLHLSDPLSACSAPPPANDRWGLFSYHHFGLYCKAFGADSPQVRALQ